MNEKEMLKQVLNEKLPDFEEVKKKCIESCEEQYKSGMNIEAEAGKVQKAVPEKYPDDAVNVEFVLVEEVQKKRTRHIGKSILAAAILVCIIMSGVTLYRKSPAHEKSSDDDFEYPAYGNGENPRDGVECYEYPASDAVGYSERIAAFRIDEAVLKAMSNEQVLYAILDYPLLDFFMQYDVMESNPAGSIYDAGDAYRELIERESEEMKEFLLDTVKVYDGLASETYGSEFTEYGAIKISGEGETAYKISRIILDEYILNRYFTAEELEYIADVCEKYEQKDIAYYELTDEESRMVAELTEEFCEKNIAVTRGSEVIEVYEWDFSINVAGKTSSYEAVYKDYYRIINEYIQKKNHMPLKPQNMAVCKAKIFMEEIALKEEKSIQTYTDYVILLARDAKDREWYVITCYEDSTYTELNGLDSWEEVIDYWPY